MFVDPQDVYEVSSVFSRRLKGITECGGLSRDFQVSEKGDNEIAGDMSEVPPCTPQFYGMSL